jgi:RNA polymerase sigma-70 factor, ECF subfamily
VALSKDGELVTRLQQGDLEALGVLYDRHRHLVFRTALGITSDAEAAADLLHDVFLRLYRFADRMDPGRPIEPWLYRMTANQSYTWVKRRCRWMQALGQMTDWLVRDGRPSPDTLAERMEQTRQIETAIAELPLPQRVVVVLYYMNDLALKEISEILDIPVGTVKSRLHYGRMALKDHLGLARETLTEPQFEMAHGA